MDATSLELRRMRAGLEALEQAVRHLRTQVTKLRAGNVSEGELETIRESVGHLETLVAGAQDRVERDQGAPGEQPAA